MEGQLDGESIGSVSGFVNKIRRAEAPGYRRLKRLMQAFRRPSRPRIPFFFKPAGRFFYHGWHSTIVANCEVVIDDQVLIAPGRSV